MIDGKKPQKLEQKNNALVYSNSPSKEAVIAFLLKMPNLLKTDFRPVNESKPLEPI